MRHEEYFMPRSAMPGAGKAEKYACRITKRLHIIIRT